MAVVGDGAAGGGAGDGSGGDEQMDCDGQGEDGQPDEAGEEDDGGVMPAQVWVMVVMKVSSWARESFMMAGLRDGRDSMSVSTLLGSASVPLGLGTGWRGRRSVPAPDQDRVAFALAELYEAGRAAVEAVQAVSDSWTHARIGVELGYGRNAVSRIVGTGGRPRSEAECGRWIEAGS